MSKKIFKPFWSLDILATEHWLSVMSIKGYHLRNFDVLTKVFIFEKGESCRMTYQICHHKASISATSQSLINNGWSQVFSKGKWSILANSNDPSEIKTHPSRDYLLKRNSIMKYSIGMLLATYLMMSLPVFFIPMSFFTAENITLYDHLRPIVLIPSLIRLSLLALLLYIIIKLQNSDKKLRMENGTNLALSFSIPTDTLLDHKTEKKLRKAGIIFKKTRLAWIYAPDKIEEWLENMELQGNNLYRLNRLGTSFFFMKGEPRKVKYCADFQSVATDSYFEIHKTNGWKLLFTSFSNITKCTLWEQEYSYEMPVLYSETSHILKHARKQCLFYCSICVPMILLELFTIGSHIIMRSEDNRPISWIMFILVSLLIIEFSYFIAISVGYYLRVRKKAKEGFYE